VSRIPNARCVIEGFVVFGARLVVENLSGVTVLILGTNVLVDQQWRQARPDNSAAKCAPLDDLAEILRRLLWKGNQ